MDDEFVIDIGIVVSVHFTSSLSVIFLCICYFNFTFFVRSLYYISSCSYNMPKGFYTVDK